MMKNIVIYKSGTGFTEQYARWIAEARSCEAIALKSAQPQTITQTEVVVFGGWVMAGKISGLDEMRKMSPAKLVVFAVGAMPASLLDTAKMAQDNGLAADELFYFQGGMKWKELGFFTKLMLNAMKKKCAGEQAPTPAQKYMAEHLGTTFDATDKANITPLVEHLKAIKK